MDLDEGNYASSSLHANNCINLFAACLVYRMKFKMMKICFIVTLFRPMWAPGAV